ncbi:farnesol kinase [Anaeramoeba ignava]|uniref:Farnesol kinase n=1 Tax=Anaeramoeba ignava TaxID=1746090 RepID=A0A9Q0LMF2_ANAIG|nr:farnesol kinase [Anaeramoeba ignava]
MNFVLAWFLILLIIILEVAITGFLAEKFKVRQIITRKLNHIFIGPTYILLWKLYPQDIDIKWKILISSIPFIFSIYYALIGLGIAKNEKLVQTISRKGDPKEFLYGPFYYGIIHTLLAIFFFQKRAAVFAVCALCFGDGSAELFGRLFGNKKLFWSPKKSYAGSFAMVVTTFLTSILILFLYDFSVTFLDLFKIVLVSIACSFVESLPYDNIDNISITSTAIIFATILF